SISGVPSWLTASTTSGTVSTSPSSVNFTVNTAAKGLAPGTYSATITFTNTTNNLGTQTRVATLTVGSPGSGGGSPPPRALVRGLGSDVNPCSFAAPCRSSQAAHDRSAAGGEIDVLDPAGYGALVIRKAISIQGHGYGGISADDGTGVTINAGASDK